MSDEEIDNNKRYDELDRSESFDEIIIDFLGEFGWEGEQEVERDSFVIWEEPIVLLWRYVGWLNPWIFLNNSER